MTVALLGQRQILSALIGRLHPRVVQRSVGGREAWIQRNRSLKIRRRGVRLGNREASQQGTTVQEGEIRLQISTAGTGRGFGFTISKAHRERTGDLVGNLILDAENVV